MIENRMVELETRFSFQEETLRELNEVVIRQQQELDRQQALLELLRAQLAELQASPAQAVSSAGHEKPPHY